ncbi:MAG: hypothetical protein EA376_04785 [Phycisphaeraceae bacterium]|nr:MAG: hypothetical protein EA376_04785 [Phycisphaeraceae bacterium]
MRTRHRNWTVPGAAAAFLVCAGASAGFQPVYEIPSLGGLNTGAWTVNNAGQVGGWTRDGSNAAFPVLWEDGVMTVLDIHPTRQAVIEDINNNGELVGRLVGGGQPERGFYYSGGVTSLLEPASGNPNHWTTASGINDFGQIVGSGQVDGPNEFQAYIWQAGTGSPTDSVPQISDVGAGFYAGHKINNSGQITGFHDSNIEPWIPWRGFTYDGTESVSLPVLGDDGSFSEAWGINDAGKITGYSDTNLFFDTRAFLYDGDTMINLGTLGGNFSSGFAVNNLDWVVGDSSNDAGDLRAFLWRDGVMMDLNDYVDPDSGWVLQRARDVSDTGWVVGLGQLNGEPRGFVLYIPSPGTAAICMIGLLAGARRRRD